MEKHRAEIERTLEEYDYQGLMRQIHSTPVGVEYESGWEFFVRADFAPIDGEPLHVINLNNLRENKR